MEVIGSGDNQCRLLHSPSLLAAVLSAWKYVMRLNWLVLTFLWLADPNIDWRIPYLQIILAHLPCIVDSRDRCEFLPFVFQKPMTVPCTTLSTGNCLLFCKETVKESRMDEVDSGLSWVTNPHKTCIAWRNRDIWRLQMLYSGSFYTTDHGWKIVLCALCSMLY